MLKVVWQVSPVTAMQPFTFGLKGISFRNAPFVNIVKYCTLQYKLSITDIDKRSTFSSFNSQHLVFPVWTTNTAPLFYKVQRVHKYCYEASTRCSLLFTLLTSSDALTCQDSFAGVCEFSFPRWSSSSQTLRSMEWVHKHWSSRHGCVSLASLIWSDRIDLCGARARSAVMHDGAFCKKVQCG